jgi:hypothetical protein
MVLPPMKCYYQELWSKYFSHIGIAARENKKLQAHFVPQRYRHHLVEFKKTVLSGTSSLLTKQ